MIDQAHKLRALVSEAGPLVEVEASSLPLILVVGGRTGVGATTVAVNLAAVLADTRESTLLVDASQHHNDPCALAGLRQSVQFGLSDVLLGKCEIHEAIVRGPAGVQMLLARGQDMSRSEYASRRDSIVNGDYSRGAIQRAMSEVQSLSKAFDWLVVDGGHENSPLLQRLRSRAKLMIVVTTPDDAAVLDCYAAVKQRAAETAHGIVRLLVNRADSDFVALRTHSRIESACQSFLSRSLPALPALPRHNANEFVDYDIPPRAWEMPNSPFGHAMLWLGRAVEEVVRGQETIDRGQDTGVRGQGLDAGSVPASGIPHPSSW